MKNLLHILTFFLILLTTLSACENTTEANGDSDNTNLQLSVGDCMDFSPSAFMVAAPNPKKVPCGSEEAKSKITKIVNNKSDCSEGYVTAYGDDKDKKFYCVKALNNE